MNVLGKICARKREHIAAMEGLVSRAAIERAAAAAPPVRGFIAALKGKARDGTAIIAEVKKASPSKGVIRADFDPVAIAKIYEAHGAACVSVLTDEPYFQGHDDYLRAITAACALPALRKDFILTPYQVYESRALGADCILLIMAALDDTSAGELHELARRLGMDVLIEVHDKEELERAIKLGPAMIGINNRSLRTLEVDIATSHTLGPDIPAGILKVAESGLESRAAITALEADGFEAFLIGESLMKQADIGHALEILL